MINKYCITNGTVNRVQRDLFEGGFLPGKADIAYAIDAARNVMLRGSMREYQDFGYAASCSGFAYQSLYCFGKTMFQNASGREIPCSQLVFCAAEDLRAGDVFLNEVIGFPYLSLEELLESGSYTKEMVFDRETRLPSRDMAMTEAQRRNIAKAVYWLLQDENVVLQLPACETYEALAFSVLYSLFYVIPSGNRRQISFSTARNGSDIQKLKGRIKLILSNETVNPFGDAKWIRLNGEEPLLPEEEIVYRWMKEPEAVRKDISGYLLDVGKADRNAGLKRVYEAFQALYDERSLWWKTAPQGKRFATFSEVMEEYRRNPTLSIGENRKAFFRSLMQRMDRSGWTEPEGDALIGLLLDYLFQEKIRMKTGKELSLIEEEGACGRFIQDCKEAFDWFGMDGSWQGRFLQEVGLLKQILLGAR